MMCVCAMHCANRCEPACCRPWMRCNCWCHERAGRPYCVGCGTIYDGHHDHCPVMAGDPDALAAQRQHDRQRERRMA